MFDENFTFAPPLARSIFPARNASASRLSSVILWLSSERIVKFSEAKICQHYRALSHIARSDAYCQSIAFIVWLSSDRLGNLSEGKICQRNRPDRIGKFL